VDSTLCTRCNPALEPVFKARGDWCETHRFPESLCPICSAKDGQKTAILPEAERPPATEHAPVPSPTAGVSAAKKEIESKVVRFKSPEVEKNAGLKTTKVRRVPFRSSISCTARVSFNRDRIADIRAIVPGLIRRIRVRLGHRVERGTPLFELESTRIGETQASLRTARGRVRTAKANLDRQRKLLAGDIASARQVELAEQELAAAKAEVRSGSTTLRLAGSSGGRSLGRYTLAAPIAGTVVRRPAALGLLADSHISLATIADTSTMWALCNITESEAGLLELGQTMNLQAGPDKRERFSGKISYIAAEVDKRTRTVLATAEIPNPQGRLRANQFAEATIVAIAPRMVLAVPKEAVQRVGTNSVVFIRSKAGQYLPRVVRAFNMNKLVAVDGKLREGDAVVTTGAYLLKTEILPDSIGAGCCEVDRPGGGG
jgi:cobalt-zinc-cadmium efflux system membrane fusion protein